MLRSLLAWFRSSKSDESNDDTDAAEPDDTADDGSVWNLIPDWQYDGVYVDKGGLARDEQERSLRSIQEQAEAIEEHEDHHPPESGDAKDRS